MLVEGITDRVIEIRFDKKENFNDDFYQIIASIIVSMNGQETRFKGIATKHPKDIDNKQLAKVVSFEKALAAFQRFASPEQYNLVRTQVYDKHSRMKTIVSKIDLKEYVVIKKTEITVK